MLYLMIALSFFTAILFIYIILSLFLENGKLVARVEEYINIQQRVEEVQEEEFLRKIVKCIFSAARQIGKFGIFNGYKKHVQFELVKAHIPLKGEEFIAICIMSAVISALAFTLVSQSIITGILFAGIGWYIPMLFMQSKKKKRIKQLNEQLGDAILLISNSLKAGYSFFQAIDTVSSEMSGSIAEEFSQLKKEINLGLATEQALENLVKRTGSDDLELVVTAIMIQRQVGGNLAEILDNISETIRERVKIKGEVRTLTAQGRMSGIIIGIIPPAMSVVLTIISPEHMKVLFTTKSGIVMIVVSVVMELIGIYFINRIVKIEV